ncbi:hypothetical protein [Mycobacterium tilburgii]|uniref:hypothetical protein n=1 Tax=Mycobacterium tilburgii TaxID=44467 RepID=UPI001181EBF9|nr:hypothetical protein [Mycobacterium tilburgii]
MAVTARDGAVWRSGGEASGGVAKSQTTLQTLALRPSPHGDLAGEMDLVVQIDECRQRSSVVRIPATLNMCRTR